MVVIGEYREYTLDDIVFCIISSSAPLTLFQEYTVKGVRRSSNGKPTKITIVDDDGQEMNYNSSRFLPIRYKYLREENLNELLK